MTRVVTSLFHFVLWVPFALTALAKLLRPRSASEKLAKKIADVQIDLEKLDTGSVSVFEIRRVIERYVGLRSLTVVELPNQKKENETIFDVAEHTNVELAIACLNRRNRERISRHQTSAAHDLVYLTGRLTAESKEPLRIRELISHISDLLGDSQTILELARPLSVKHQESETKQWTELPKPPTTSPVTIDLPIR